MSALSRRDALTAGLLEYRHYVDRWQCIYGTMNGYQGHRILEAMRSAPRYADAVFRQICSVVPPAGSVLLGFGAGDGVFFEKVVVEGYRVDCVEPDIVLQRSLSALGGQVYPDIFSVPSSSYDFVYSVNVI